MTDWKTAGWGGPHIGPHNKRLLGTTHYLAIVSLCTRTYLGLVHAGTRVREKCQVWYNILRSKGKGSLT